MKFSIVIPVYNAAQYIEQSVESLIRQMGESDELILVDDGSKDESLQICNQLAGKYTCLKVIHQENSGPSSARNAGIEAATGDYLLFVDADDIVTDTWLKTICEYEEKYNADVMCFGYCTVREDYRGEIDMIPESKTYTDREEVVCNMVSIIDGFFFNVVWNKVYKLSFIKENNIRFDQSIYIGEDRKFCLDVISCCNSWCMLPESLYRYLVRNTASISAKCDLVRMEQMLNVQSRYREVLQLTTLDQEEQEARSEYEIIKICTSHMMDAIRSNTKRKYAYCKKIYRAHVIKYSGAHSKIFRGVKKITYRAWTLGWMPLMYGYAGALCLYKYKMKLYKESNEER